MVAPRSPSPTKSTVASTPKLPTNQNREHPSPPSIDAENIPSRPLVRILSPSTPPPGTPPEMCPLESRVAELETKLAVLSRLIQTQQLSGRQPSSPTPDSPSNSSFPPLESPHPLERTRRLSTWLLHEDSGPRLPHLNAPVLNVSEEESSESKTEQPEPEQKSIRSKWMDYLDNFQESTPDVDLQMEEFVRVPSQLEALLTFGFGICVNCFLYVLTILPIRFAWSVLLLIRTSLKPNVKRYKFHRRHLYQFIQVSIIYITYRYVLCPISIGRLYHWIRGQAMLKLYVLIAIVEVFDRLMCALGQDCMDSMYWNTTKQPRSMRMLVSFVVVLCYAIAHTLILFVHVATLNVAMNSADQALLALLISGNFAEIKSTVFKKYNKPNLFKITASDICERFKLALFLTLVLVLNMCQGMDWRMTYQYLSMCGIVWVAEILADWIKHSFITKFNFVQSKVYLEYALLLAGDVTGFGHEGVNLDHSHAVVKRIGFAQTPLICVMMRLLTEAFRYAQPHFAERPWWAVHVSLLFGWLLLFGTKLLLGSYLQRVSLAKLQAAPDVAKKSSLQSKKRK